MVGLVPIYSARRIRIITFFSKLYELDLGGGLLQNWSALVIPVTTNKPFAMLLTVIVKKLQKTKSSGTM